MILRGKKNLFCSNLTKYLTFQGSSLQDGLKKTSCTMSSHVSGEETYFPAKTQRDG